MMIRAAIFGVVFAALVGCDGSSDNSGFGVNPPGDGRGDVDAGTAAGTGGAAGSGAAGTAGAAGSIGGHMATGGSAVGGGGGSSFSSTGGATGAGGSGTGCGASMKACPGLPNSCFDQSATCPQGPGCGTCSGTCGNGWCTGTAEFACEDSPVNWFPASTRACISARKNGYPCTVCYDGSGIVGPPTHMDCTHSLMSSPTVLCVADCSECS